MQSFPLKKHKKKMKKYPAKPKYMPADPTGAQAVSHESWSVVKQLENILKQFMIYTPKDYKKRKYKITSTQEK